MCGYIRYKDQYGNIVEESGYCITDTNIQIVASEILQVIGLNTEICDAPNLTNYQVNISGNITCNPQGGDGLTGYSNYCTGNTPFTVSSLSGVASGYIRMVVDAGTGDIGIQKTVGALALNEIVPITEQLEATFAGSGSNPPEAYPWGYPPSITPIVYSFQYSPDGVNSWDDFTITIA